MNVKSLAAEARIIRKEEQRCGGNYRYMLYEHRVGYLRLESRLAGLALAYVKGTPYAAVEVADKTKRPDVISLVKKICRAGTPGGFWVTESDVQNWMNGVHAVWIDRK